MPVLFALAAIWIYFGVALPTLDVVTGGADSFRSIFLSPRNIYNLFMQSAVIATLAVGITIVLLLGDIDLSAAATAGVCAALLGVLVLAGVPGWLACIMVMGVGIVMGAAQGTPRCLCRHTVLRRDPCGTAWLPGTHAEDPADRQSERGRPFRSGYRAIADPGHVGAGAGAGLRRPPLPPSICASRHNAGPGALSSIRRWHCGGRSSSSVCW